MFGKHIQFLKRVMATSNIKMKHKKGLFLFSTVIVWTFALLLVALMAVFMFSGITNSSQALEKSSPELTYQFPIVFVQSFLNMPIREEDLERLSLSSGQIKDIVIRRDGLAREIVEEHRQRYLESYGYDTEFYQQFKDFNPSYRDPLANTNLLDIRFIDTIPNLEETILEGNYFFYLKAEGEGFVIIGFRNGENLWCQNGGCES